MQLSRPPAGEQLANGRRARRHPGSVSKVFDLIQCQFLLQRALAAFFAETDRCFFVIFFARPVPPLRPPRPPNSTAAGFLRDTNDAGSSALPSASPTISSPPGRLRPHPPPLR